MKLIATRESAIEATGHPSNCEEPADGSVVAEAVQSLTIQSPTDGTQPIGTITSADINIPKHPHNYGDIDGCHDEEAHTLDPVPERIATVTVTGSRMYLKKDDIQNDPKTGDPIHIADAGVNSTVTFTRA